MKLIDSFVAKANNVIKLARPGLLSISYLIVELESVIALLIFLC